MSTPASRRQAAKPQSYRCPPRRRGLLLSLRFGATDLAVLEDLIDTARAGGINLLCIELERGLRTDRHPELAAPWAVNKPDLRRIIDHARRSGMEVVPALALFSHQDYILRAHPEWRDPRTRFPRFAETAWRRCEMDLLDEALDLFQPRLAHIGHDEAITAYDARRRVPVASSWRVFADHVTRLHDHLAARGVRTMLWADMLLDPARFRGACFAHSGCYGGAPDHFDRALDRLPRDIVLCDWHYEMAPEFPSLRHLQDSGFETIACGRFPVNMALLTRYALIHRTPRFGGMMATLWHAVNRRNHKALRALIVQNAATMRGEPLAFGDAVIAKALAAPLSEPLPAGPFHRTLSFAGDAFGPFASSGWTDLRYAEYLRATDDRIAGPRLPHAMELRAGRCGRIAFSLTVQPGLAFRELRVRAWLPSPCANAISVATPRQGERLILSSDRPLRGRGIDVTTIVRGESCVGISLSFDNRSDRTWAVFARLEFHGVAAPPVFK